MKDVVTAKVSIPMEDVIVIIFNILLPLSVGNKLGNKRRIPKNLTRPWDSVILKLPVKNSLLNKTTGKFS
jgi:hypothetical protein